jgi:tRNA1Val (adenine37-N6)-methyltransferase
MSRRLANPWFDFKQFRVLQHQAGMRVTTHACLLGALIDPAPLAGHPEGRILDIGTGTGLLALMLAQRCSAPIDAVEMDDGALRDAGENFARSPWAGRLQLIPHRFQDYATSCTLRYPLIVSNPPFFSASMAAVDAARHLARHDDALPLAELLAGAARLLTSEGRLWLLLPDIAEARLRALGAQNDLFVVQRIALQNLPGRHADRCIFELSRQAGVEQRRELVIYQPHPQYSPECRALLAPYYASL